MKLEPSFHRFQPTIHSPYNYFTYKSEQRIGRTVTRMLYAIHKILETEVEYLLRCLDKVNEPFDKDKMVYVSDGYQQVYCLIYPYNDEKNLRKINPLFCSGIKLIHNMEMYGEYYVDIKRINGISELIETLSKPFEVL